MTLDLFRRLALALERHGRIAIAAVLALSFLAVVVSALDAIHSGGIDLRPKVLGARALLAASTRTWRTRSDGRLERRLASSILKPFRIQAFRGSPTLRHCC